MSFPEPNGARPSGTEPAGVPPNGTAASGPAPARRAPTPVPLVLSCVAGAAGLVLLVAGAVSATSGLSVAGVMAGSMSLGAALYWRSLLISSWAERKRDRPPR